MAKKSKLLQEIGENMKNYNLENINIEELNIEILKELSNSFMVLEDSRHGSYYIHFYMKL